jgi:hypothetical protein
MARSRALLVVATVVLASLSQANAQTKELKPDKFHTSATTAPAPAFMYTFDYAECTGPPTSSIFKDYSLAGSIVGDLTAVHAPAYTKCAGDIQANFADADFKMSNGVRFPGGTLAAPAPSAVPTPGAAGRRDALKSAPFTEEALLKVLCGGAGSGSCTNGNFGFTLELWINIKDYDTAFENTKVTHLLQIGSRMGLRLVRTGGLNLLFFSLNVAGSAIDLSSSSVAGKFNSGLNLITVTGTFAATFGITARFHINGGSTGGQYDDSTSNAADTISWNATQEAVVRLGTADVDGITDVMFKGAIHLAGLHYATATPNADDIAAALIARGLPNNPPVVIPNAYIFTNEDLPATVGTSVTADFNPNTTTDATVQIYDFDSITHPLAIRGGFEAQNYTVAAGATVPTTLAVTPWPDTDTFNVTNTEANKFTVYDNTACDSTLSLASLPVLVTDDGCGGSAAACATESNVHVCVISQKDKLALGSFNQSPFLPKYQASTPLTITATDVDNLDGTQYNYKVDVAPTTHFSNVTLFTYAAGVCTDTEVPSPSPYEFTFTATTTFTFCYKHIEPGLKNAPNANEPHVLTTTALAVTVTRQDGNDLLNVATSDSLVIKVVNPISTCEVVAGVPSPCEVTSVKENTIKSIDGAESDTTGNKFKLTLQDSRGLAAVDQYRIKLTSVPNPETQGKLYKSSDTALASPLAANALLSVSSVDGSTTDAVGEELRFVPVPDFFTRVDTSTYPENKYLGGEGLPNPTMLYNKFLAMSNEGFLGCSASEYPGCAVKFTHTIVKYKGSTGAEVESESAEGEVLVHVDAVETLIEEEHLIFPVGNMSYVRDDAVIKFQGDRKIQFNFTGTSRTTADDESFPVELRVSASTGSFTAAFPTAGKLNTALSATLPLALHHNGGGVTSCLRTSCPGTFVIRGSPALINEALALLTYEPTTAVGTKTIKAQVKDGNGIIAFEKTFDVIVSKDAGGVGASGLATSIIIVLGSVGGIVLCVCLGITCLILSRVTCFVRIAYSIGGVFSHSAHEHKLEMDRQRERQRRGSYDSDSDVEDQRKHKHHHTKKSGGRRNHSIDSRDDRRRRDKREKKERARHYDRNSKSYKPHAPKEMFASGDKGAKTLVVVPQDSLFDWEKHIDKDTGDVYFFNPKTGKSQWHPPAVKSS